MPRRSSTAMSRDRTSTGAGPGWLITVGGTPKEMLAHPGFTLFPSAGRGRHGPKLGAQIMGLGAFTKVVGDASVTVISRRPSR